MSAYPSAVPVLPGDAEPQVLFAAAKIQEESLHSLAVQDATKADEAVPLVSRTLLHPGPQPDVVAVSALQALLFLRHLSLMVPEPTVVFVGRLQGLSLTVPPRESMESCLRDVSLYLKFSGVS